MDEPSFLPLISFHCPPLANPNRDPQAASGGGPCRPAAQAQGQGGEEQIEGLSAGSDGRYPALFPLRVDFGARSAGKQGH